jgi:Tfp pilus assembly protein PilF
MKESLEKRGVFAVAALALLLFLNILPNTFMWDDWDVLFHNPVLRASDGIEKIFTANLWAFAGKNYNYYRPLFLLWDYAALRWFGSNPAGYHAASILMHTLISVLLYLLIRRWSRDDLIALGAALLFAAHPIHTENVCWITDFDDLQLALFTLLALLFYTAAANTRWRPLIAIGVGTCFLLGLLAKEMGIVIPIACLAWDIAERRKLHECWREYLSMGVAFAVYLGLRIHALGGVALFRKSNNLTWDENLYTKIALAYRYCLLLVWPSQLTAFPAFPASRHWWEWRVLAGAACLALLAWGTMRLWRARRLEAFALTLAAGALAPAFTLPYTESNMIAERYLYLPSIAFCWLIASLFSTVATRWGRQPTALLFLALLSAYAVRTEIRNLDWRSEIPFYQKAIVISPGIPELHVLLAGAYYSHEMVPEAASETQMALSLKPDYPEAANNLGQIYSRMNQPEKAAEQFAQAIRYHTMHRDPSFTVAQAYNNLAFELNRMGRTGDAIAAYRQGLAIDPGLVGAYNNLGYIFLEQGKFADAESNLLHAVQIAPTFYQAASNLGLLYTRTGKLDAAAKYLTEAARLEPRSGETFARLGELALARGDRVQARDFFRHALELQPDNKRALLDRLR